MDGDVLLNSEDKHIVIEHLYTIEDYITLTISVKSGEFSGASNFCIPKERIASINMVLSEMYNNLKGRCEINDADSDSCIMFEMDKYGHMFISGQIGGSYEEHVMKFRLATDQTVLNGLIQILNKLL